MKKTYTVLAFNTCTSQYEKTEVTKEVYDEYRRGAWRIGKNNSKYSAYETPFSALVGGEDEAYENFHEFIDTEHTPENAVLHGERKQLSNVALNLLTDTMRRRFLLRYESGLAIKEIASLEGVSEDAIKDSLEAAKEKMKSFLKKFEKQTP